ncbi:MAG: carboxylesterase family protein [Nevskia sp.]|nr:carboxylesterase family protein [Nevskia sp.]
MPRLHGICKAAILGALVLAAGCSAGDKGAAATDAPQPQASLVRNTRYGAVLGTAVADGAAYAWLGIPYAKPPLGSLRWSPPADPDPWPEPRFALAPGSPCSQIGSLYGPPAQGQPWGSGNADWFGAPVGREDCLYLNIWRPAGDVAGLPVLVFIHGGSNIYGYSGDPMYDGAAFASQANAVVVSMNYRLGVFGWLVHSALHTGDPVADSGNYGTLDLIKALQFVHDNIAAFGGDPGKVTLMGHSAGAINLFSLMASPRAAGLFHRAISLSGMLLTSTQDNGSAYAQQLLQQLAIRDGYAADSNGAQHYLAAQTPAWISSYLRSKADTELLVAATAAGAPPLVFNDGTVVAAQPEAALASLPFLDGETAEEGKLLAENAFKVSDAQRFRLMLQSDPDTPSTLHLGDLVKPVFLPGVSPALYDAYTGVYTAGAHAVFASSLHTVAAHQPKTYAYSFDWARQPQPWNVVYGACHLMDVPFIFGNFHGNLFSEGFGGANASGRAALSTAMMQSIAAFMRSGDPNTPALGTAWAPYGSAARRLHFDATPQAAQITMQ